jgi:D-lyxose ketol-isomerase
MVNQAVRNAAACFEAGGWALPPEPRWDVTDFGLGDFPVCGLVLINLAEEPEYCEKLMYARQNQITPAHAHRQKKEDIICRRGVLIVQVWPDAEQNASENIPFNVQVNGRPRSITHENTIRLTAGERITLVPGIYHAFYPESEECIIGEVSTANDDLHDNFFINPHVGRYSSLEEDEPPLVKLVSDQ